MSFFTWLLRQWQEGDEILRRGTRFTVQAVEQVRRWRRREPLLRGRRFPRSRFPTATGPPRRRSRRHLVDVEETIEEDDPE